LSHRFSLLTRESVAQFKRTGDAHLVPTITAGIIQRFTEPDLGNALEGPCGDMRLAEDLGFDSLLMIECVMVFEDVFGEQIPHSELIELRTVGDVSELVLNRLENRKSESEERRLA